MAVAVTEAPRSTAEIPVANQAFYLHARNLLNILNKYERTGHRNLNTKAFIPFVFTLAVVLSGCSTIETSQIAAYQAQINGLPNGTLSLGAGGADLPFTLVHASEQPVLMAREAGATDVEIDGVLSKIDRRFGAYAQGPLTVELTCGPGGNKTQSSCDLKIRPNGDGVGRVVLQESECAPVGYTNQVACARPLEYVFNVDSHITPPVLAMGFQLSPDGKTMQVVGSAQDAAGIRPDSVRFARCEDGKPLAVSGTTAKAAAPVTLLPGDNCVAFSATDTRGNRSEINGGYPYQFSIAIAQNPILDQDGKINIAGSLANNTFKIGSVTLAHCGTLENNPDLSGAATVNPDGTFQGKIKPVPGVNDCVEAIATDTQGVRIIAQNKNIITYQLDPGYVYPFQDPQNPQLWYILGNPPSNVDAKTARANGSQPEWKQFGATGTFQCDRLPDGTKFSGTSFAYALRCALPSSAGPATLTFNIFDKNGYSMSASYQLPMPENPTARELAEYFGPAIAAILASLTATGVLADYVHKSLKRDKVARKVREACAHGDFIGASNYLDTIKVNRDWKVKLGEEITHAQLLFTQESLSRKLADSAGGGMKNGRLRSMVSATDDLNFILAHEAFPRDPAVARAFFSQLHGWTDANLYPDVPPLSWSDLETSVGSKNHDAGVFMRHAVHILTRDRYRHIREHIKAYDRETDGHDQVHKNGPLLGQLHEVALMYELTRNDLFKPEIFRPLVVNGMGFEEATRILWKWGRYAEIKGIFSQAAARYGGEAAVIKTVKQVSKK